MSETDLQLGGGYTYQWECAILLALNYFFEPVRYNPTLFDLINDFLGQVAEIHLEGEEGGVELEDINLINGDRRILIQVKTKQAEGKLWTPTDPLLLKALYKFYDSHFLDAQPDNVHFVFLTNRPFNRTLVQIKSAISQGTIDQCVNADKLCKYLAKEKKKDIDAARFRKMLARTALVEYLAVDEVKANIQAKLQAQGRHDWQRAHAVLFEDFSRRSTRIGGGIVTRASLMEVPGPPPDRPSLVSYTPPPLPDPDTLSDLGPLPPGSRLPFHRNDLFTGRGQALRDLAQALLHDGAGSTLVTQAVQGMGGIGKTQLAVEFAFRYGRYFHGVHWINAAQPEGIEAEVAECGTKMLLPRWPTELPEQVERTLSEWQSGGPRLVILDNLEDPGAAGEWMARLGSPVRLLLTARRIDWPDGLGLTPLRLDIFTREESHTFLRQYLPDGRATDADLHALADRLGYLPLALELAGRYLKRVPRLTVTAYQDKLKDIWEHRSMKGWRKDLKSSTNSNEEHPIFRTKSTPYRAVSWSGWSLMPCLMRIRGSTAQSNFESS